MNIPGFVAEASLCTIGKQHTLGTMETTLPNIQNIILAALPTECRQVGASQPWTDTHCAGPFGGFIMWCIDKCRVPDSSRGPMGREVSGFPYPCGICVGFW
jgi:hypothetical protein